jgi:hypothetical protein
VLSKTKCARAPSRHDVARAAPPRRPCQHRAARGHLATEAAPSPRAHAPRLLGVLPGRAPPLVCAVPAGRAPRTAGPLAVSRHTCAGRGRQTTTASSRSRRRHRRPSPLFNAAFHPHAHRHCHSRRHDRRLSELPFFPSVLSPADTPNTSSSSHVSRSLCLWACRKPPSPATPPTAAAAAGPRCAPTPACSPPQHRSPPGPRWAHGRASPLPRPGAQPVRRNLAGVASSHGQGPDCESPLPSRVLCVI